MENSEGFHYFSPEKKLQKKREKSSKMTRNGEGQQTKEAKERRAKNSKIQLKKLVMRIYSDYSEKRDEVVIVECKGGVGEKKFKKKRK